jgi:putative aldouronate transport system permease protein
MVQDKTFGSRAFDVLNIALLAFLAAVCVAPFVHTIAVSFSSSGPVAGNLVRFLPIRFTLGNYETVFGNMKLWRSFLWSFARAGAGTTLSLLMAIVTAYPMSRSRDIFPARTGFVVLFLFTMLFRGGLIPRFIVVRWLGLYDRFWALVIPFGFNAWVTILLMNFYRNLPEEMEEAALIDGANHLDVLFRIYVPLASPAIATMALFQIVFFWNDWFFPSLYLRDSSRYPLQTYLQLFLNQANVRELFARGDVEAFLQIVSNRGLRAATLVTSMVPILLIYPILQRYFVKGITLGAVKG